MNKQELITFLQDNMRVEVKFNTHGRLGTNQFEIKIWIDEQEICKDHCCIDPTDNKSDW